MSATPELTPLRPREFFGRPWSGQGEWRPPLWLRWLPGPRRLRFRSFTTWLTDELSLVHDTTTWEDGRVKRRDFLATLVAPDRIRLQAPRCRAAARYALTFSPHLISPAVPLLPVRVLLRCRDTCRLDPNGELVDTIDISLLGLPFGRQVVRLRRE